MGKLILVHRRKAQSSITELRQRKRNEDPQNAQWELAGGVLHTRTSAVAVEDRTGSVRCIDTFGELGRKWHCAGCRYLRRARILRPHPTIRSRPLARIQKRCVMPAIQQATLVLRPTTSASPWRRRQAVTPINGPGDLGNRLPMQARPLRCRIQFRPISMAFDLLASKLGLTR